MKPIEANFWLRYLKRHIRPATYPLGYVEPFRKKTQNSHAAGRIQRGALRILRAHTVLCISECFQPKKSRGLKCGISKFVKNCYYGPQ